MGNISDLVNTHQSGISLTGSSCAGYCHCLGKTILLVSSVPTVNISVTDETVVDAAPDSGAGELGGRTDQGGTVSLVTAVPAVSVAVTPVVSGHTLPRTGAGKLSRGAGSGGTLRLISPVLAVRDPVTLPGLGQTPGRTRGRSRAGKLSRAAGLVSCHFNILLVRIISTVIISIFYPVVWNTLPVMTLKLRDLALEYGV